MKKGGGEHFRQYRDPHSGGSQTGDSGNAVEGKGFPRGEGFPQKQFLDKVAQPVVGVIKEKGIIGQVL